MGVLVLGKTNKFDTKLIVIYRSRLAYQLDIWERFGFVLVQWMVSPSCYSMVELLSGRREAELMSPVTCFEAKPHQVEEVL